MKLFLLSLLAIGLSAQIYPPAQTGGGAATNGVPATGSGVVCSGSGTSRICTGSDITSVIPAGTYAPLSSNLIPITYLPNITLTTNVTGTLPIGNGGTGAATPATALASIGALPTSGGTMTGNLTNGPTILNNLTGIATTFDCEAYVNLNSCLDAAKAYVTINETGNGKTARVLIPNGTYSLTSYPYTLNSGMQLVGTGGRTEYLPGQFPDSNMVLNGGTTIDCGGTGNTCFNGSGLRGIMLENLCFRNFGTVASFGSNNVDGVSFSKFVNLFAVGSTTVGASANGFVFYNFNHIRVDGVYIFNVNTGMSYIQQSSTGNYGNAYVSDTYMQVYPKSVANGNSAAPGMVIQNLSPATGTPGTMNDLDFYHLQINSFGGDSTGTNLLIAGLPSYPITGLTINGLDNEGQVLYATSVSYAWSSRIQLATGGGTYDFNVGTGTQYSTFNCDWRCNVNALPASGTLQNTFLGNFVSVPQSNLNGISLSTGGLISSGGANFNGSLYAGSMSTNGFTAFSTITGYLYEGSITTIASAANITPNSAVVHVTGTATINNLNLPGGMGTTVGGCVTLIADGAWNMTTAGNIFAAVTATTGSTYQACYGGSKWYVK